MTVLAHLDTNMKKSSSDPMLLSSKYLRDVNVDTGFVKLLEEM